MTDAEIYKAWPFKMRYLRLECWEAIKYQLILHKITSAIEFGAGISSILFNNFGIDTVSYETDPVYLRYVKSFNLSNVEFRLWNNEKADIEGFFGLALVDGILPRTRQLHYAQQCARYIAIDDFNDPESNTGLEEMLSGYTRIDDGTIKLAIFRKVPK